MKNNRRNFISTASVLGAGLAIGLPTVACASGGQLAKPAILGGPKAFTGKWLGWPVIGQIEEKELLDVTYHYGFRVFEFLVKEH